jgi:exopolysaccharide biosynthesis polyprenyl glycosylphosphotransferase
LPGVLKSTCNRNRRGTLQAVSSPDLEDMATSEYLRNGKGGQRSQAPVLQIPPPSRHAVFGSATVTSAVMMSNDILMVVLAFVIALTVRTLIFARIVSSVLPAPSLWPSAIDLVSLAWFAFAYVIAARRYGLYGPVPAAAGAHELRLVIQGCLNAGLLLCGALYMFHAVGISRILIALLVGAAVVTLSVRRVLWRYARYQQYEQGVELRNVMILGTNQLSYALSRHIRDYRRLGYRFVGFVTAPGAPVSSEIASNQILGGVDKIRQLARQHFVDEMVIAEFYPTESAIRLVQDARELDIDVRAISGYYSELTTNAPVEYLGIFPVSSLHRSQPRVIGLFCKRVVDTVLSLIALILTAPLMILTALAIKIESRGPVFYVSDRIGKRGRVFPCFKFRTMVDNADKMKKDLTAFNERDAVLFKLSNDPRVTRLGRILRKYSLDELPQFLNVLRGEMSIVGPRPPIASEVEKYELEHFRRLEVLPGLTGLWQVQARHDPSFAKYIALDTAYVENWSFWLDLRILIQTANVVVRGTGA